MTGALLDILVDFIFALWSQHSCQSNSQYTFHRVRNLLTINKAAVFLLMVKSLMNLQMSEVVYLISDNYKHHLFINVY